MSIFDNVDQVQKIGKTVTDTLIQGAVVSEKIDKVKNFYGLNVSGNPGDGKEEEKKPETIIAPLREFLAQVRTQGFARTNQYSFLLAPPQKVVKASNIGSDLRLFNLLCAHATIPGVNIATMPIRRFGEIVETPNDKNYGVLNSTFYVDNSMYVKAFFDAWIGQIQDPTSRTFGWYKEYVANIEITVYDIHGKPHYKVVLEEAFPKTIGDISLAQDSREVMRLDVSWSYRRAMTYHLGNNVRVNEDPNSPWYSKIDLTHEGLISYAGSFKDYQNRFNAGIGDISRTESLLTSGDWGGLAGQNLGGGWL